MFTTWKCHWSQVYMCLYFLYIYEVTVRKWVEKTEMDVLLEFVAYDNVWNFVQKYQEWDFWIASVEIMEIICKLCTGVLVMPCRLEQPRSEKQWRCGWRQTFLLSFCMACDVKICIDRKSVV